MIDDYAEIESELKAQGYKPFNKMRTIRKLELTYHGIILSKKNRHIISSHGGIIPDSKARENEDDMIQQFTSQLRAQGINDSFIKTKTEQVLEANSKNTKYAIQFEIWRANNIRRDLDNQTTTLLDALTESFAIADDSHKYLKQIVAIDRGLDKDNPRAEITIKIAEDSEED